MGLLDNDLQNVFTSVFAPLLLDVTITNVTQTYADNGDVSSATETAAAKGMVEEYSAFTRAQAGIPDTDVKLIILQKDVDLTPTLDSTITIRGVTYSVQRIEQDPAQASWTIQGRPDR